MRHARIDAHGKAFALTEMCAVLDVSVSGYRAWKRGGTPGRKRLTDAQMLAVIRALHAELKGAYGSPRMIRELRLRGFTAGKERIERLMRGTAFMPAINGATRSPRTRNTACRCRTICSTAASLRRRLTASGRQI